MPDQRIQYTEEMVGAGHPTKADTLNRLALERHNTDGTHKVFESAEQTITSGGPLTLAHGLGASPKFLQLALKCQTAEAGFSVGDEILISPYRDSDGTNMNRGVTVRFDATNIRLRFGNQTNVFVAHQEQATVGDPAALTNVNWKLIVRAWLP